MVIPATCNSQAAQNAQPFGHQEFTNYLMIHISHTNPGEYFADGFDKMDAAFSLGRSY